MARSVYCAGATVIVINELFTVTDDDNTISIQAFISSIAVVISTKVQAKVTVAIAKVILDMINPMLLFLPEQDFLIRDTTMINADIAIAYAEINMT